MRVFSIALLALVLVAGCKPGASDSPTKVVNSFLSAMKEGDIESIKKLITKSDANLLQMAESAAAIFKPEKVKEMREKMTQQFKEKATNVKFEVKDEKIEGDNASVNVSITDKDKTETHPFRLQKEEGVWKVALMSTGMSMGGNDKNFSPEDMQKEMDKMGNLPDSIDNAMKSLKDMNLNLDSLQDVMKKKMHDKGVNLDSLNNEIKKLKF